MARFDRFFPGSINNDKEKLDRLYTYLYYAKSALDDSWDIRGAAMLQNLLMEYRSKGGSAQYKYAPMN